jgi:tetratricopeptide (TPR) repeat protein
MNPATGQRQDLPNATRAPAGSRWSAPCGGRDLMGLPSRAANPFRRSAARLFWLWALIVAALQAPAASPTASFEAANKLYEEGKFTAAVIAYQQMLHAGQASAALYFNLGNACFKAGQVGRAIAAYRQAEQLTPRDPDIRANLQFARNQVQGPTLPSTWWQHWLGALGLNEWTWLAAGSLWLCCSLLTLLQCRPGLQPALRRYVALSGLGTFLLWGCFGAAWCQTRSGRLAIVIAPEAVVRQGPLDESQTAFTVHDGAELRVLDHKDDWLQVCTDSRRIGWLHRAQVLPLPGA